MMNKFEKKALLLEVLGEVVERLENDKKWMFQEYKCIDEETGKWEYVDVEYEDLNEKQQCKIDAMDAVIKHLEKLI